MTDDEKAEAVVNGMEHGKVIMTGRAGFWMKLQPTLYADEYEKLKRRFRPEYTKRIVIGFGGLHCKRHGIRFRLWKRSPYGDGFEGVLSAESSLCRSCGATYDQKWLDLYD